MNIQSQTKKGAIYLTFSALIYSTISILIRLLDAGNIPPSSQAFLRYIVAFITAIVYLKLSKSKFQIPKQNIPLLITISVIGYAFTNLFFTYGVINTLVSNALFIFYSFAIITPIFGYLILKERINSFNIISLIITVFALLLLFQPNPYSTWKIGTLFAFLSALAQSFYLIGRRKLKTINSHTILVSSTFFGMVTVGLIALVLDSSFYFSPNGISAVSRETWLLILLAGLANFTAWFLMSKGFEYVKASIGSLILLVENIFVVILALLFFQEVPTISTSIGGLLILTAAGIAITKGDSS